MSGSTPSQTFEGKVKRKEKTAIKSERVKKFLKLFPDYSTNWIAKKARVSWMFVGKIRVSFGSNSEIKRKGKDGKYRVKNNRRRNNIFPT